jgi:hypothetical protein
MPSNLFEHQLNKPKWQLGHVVEMVFWTLTFKNMYAMNLKWKWNKNPIYDLFFSYINKRLKFIWYVVWNTQDTRYAENQIFTPMRFYPFHNLWFIFTFSSVFLLDVGNWFIFHFNATFSNISAISWRPVLVVEAGLPEENHRPWASNW